MLIKLDLDLSSVIKQIKNQQYRLRSSEGFNDVYKELINKELDTRVEKEAKDILIKEIAEKQLKTERKPNILKTGKIYKEKPQVDKYEEIRRLKKVIKDDNTRVINTFQSWAYINKEFNKNTKYRKILRWNKQLLDKVTEKYKKYILEGNENTVIY
jgi:hypothetical protein